MEFHFSRYRIKYTMRRNKNILRKFSDPTVSPLLKILALKILFLKRSFSIIRVCSSWIVKK